MQSPRIRRRASSPCPLGIDLLANPASWDRYPEVLRIARAAGSLPRKHEDKQEAPKPRSQHRRIPRVSVTDASNQADRREKQLITIQATTTPPQPRLARKLAAKGIRRRNVAERPRSLANARACRPSMQDTRVYERKKREGRRSDEKRRKAAPVRGTQQRRTSRASGPQIANVLQPNS